MLVGGFIRFGRVSEFRLLLWDWLGQLIVPAPGWNFRANGSNITEQKTVGSMSMQS